MTNFWILFIFCYILFNFSIIFTIFYQKNNAARYKQKTLEFLKKDFYLFTFREKGREGEREGEKHQCVVASCVAPTGDLAHNRGHVP